MAKLLSPRERAERSHLVLAEIMAKFIRDSWAIEQLLRNLADPPPCEGEHEEEKA